MVKMKTNQKQMEDKFTSTNFCSQNLFLLTVILICSIFHLNTPQEIKYLNALWFYQWRFHLFQWCFFV